MNEKLVTPGSTRRNLLFSGSHKEHHNNYNRVNTYSGGNSSRKVEAFASLVGVSGNNANAGQSSASSSSLNNTFWMNTLSNINKGVMITD